MEPVAELEFRGGHVALDFVNTAEGRDGPGPGGDALRTVGDLWVWGQRRGVLSPGEFGAAADDSAQAAELTAAVEARELLYRVLQDRARGERAAAADVTRLGRLASRAYQAAQLKQEEDGRLGWSWDPARLATVRHVAVTSALELLGQSPAARLGQCPGGECGWFFLDTTKRGNRRWCSMGECGQNAKTARRRERAAKTRP